MSDNFFDDLLPGVLSSESTKKLYNDEITPSENSEAISTIPISQKNKIDKATSEIAEPTQKEPHSPKQDIKAQPHDVQASVYSEPSLKKTKLFGCPIEEQRARSGWGVLGRVSGEIARIDLQI